MQCVGTQCHNQARAEKCELPLEVGTACLGRRFDETISWRTTLDQIEHSEIIRPEVKQINRNIESSARCADERETDTIFRRPRGFAHENDNGSRSSSIDHHLRAVLMQRTSRARTDFVIEALPLRPEHHPSGCDGALHRKGEFMGGTHSPLHALWMDEPS